MPVETYRMPVQGTLVQVMTADASVWSYRFVSIVGQMRVGLTTPGMLGIGVVVPPNPGEGGLVLVQSTGLAKVLVDQRVLAGDPVCIGPQGGVMPIEANGHLVGIAAESGGAGDVIKVLLNIASDFEPADRVRAQVKLGSSRLAVRSHGVVKEEQPAQKTCRRQVSLDG